MSTDSSPGPGEPVFRSFQITTRNRFGAIALAIAVIALGGVFVIFGLVLLAGLAVVGTVVGAGLMLYRRLTGRWPGNLSRGGASRSALDPSREVFSNDVSSVDRSVHNDSQLPPGI